jgi:hypothetical protein
METRMAVGIKNKLAEMHEKWGSSVVPGSSIDEQIQQLAEGAAAIGLNVYEGFILYAGPNSFREDINFFVAFKEVESGERPAKQFAFPWPQWAYEIALQSLLYKKRVIVVSDGKPTEDANSKIVDVLILQKDL